jgi:tetratricopeptide (TPR) repeat protein
VHTATETAPAEPHRDLAGIDWGRFVGRREELDQLKGALEQTLSGKGALVMLGGEPGIGKTRLAEEFAVYAGLRGAQVLSGRAYEGEASVPYRPFVEALRQHVRSRPDDELRRQMGPGAPEVATLVSEVRRRFPDIEEVPRLEPEAERLRLFESVSEFLHNAATANPVVLFLDDLHWADKPSLLLLQHVARNSGGDRLLIVGAYRDVELDRRHPLADALAALRRLPNYRRVLLRGLSEETISDLLTAMDPSEAGAARWAALAQALYRETEGNPFFIHEVLAHLIETGKIAREGGRWVNRVTSISELGIPEGVREVVGRRLSRLSEGCNRMLTLASTMAGGFSWDALKAICTDVPEAQLLDLLEETLAAQLIAERKREGAGTYDFTHALIRQTLYEELSTPRRVLLHRQIGEALEKLYAANVEPHLAELAHHFYQAAPGGDLEKAIDYSRRAGERAMEVYAWEEATGYFERAIESLELKPDPDDALHCDLLVNLGTAQNAERNASGARKTLLSAARLARDVLSEYEPRRPRLLARAALGLAWALDLDEALSASRAAAGLIASSEGTDAAATYLAEAARISFSAGFMRGAWELATQGLGYVGERRDPTWAQLMTYEILRQEAEDPDNPGIPLDTPERREVSRIARELPPEQRPRIASAYASRADVLADGGDNDPVALVFLAGDYRRGRVVWQETARQHEQRGQIANAISDWAQVARCCNALGDFEAAHEACDRAMTLAEKLGTPSQQALQLASVRIEMRFTIDPDDEHETVLRLEPLLKQPAVETQWASAALRATAAFSYAWVGRNEEALCQLGTLEAPLRRAPAWAPNYTLLACLAAYTLWVLQCTDGIDLIKRSVKEKVVDPDFRFPMQDGRLSMARLCALEHRYEEAEGWLESARQVIDEQGARPLRALTDLTQAEMYLRRAQAGDTTLARPRLEGALLQFHELGMSGWARRTEQLLNQ